MNLTLALLLAPLGLGIVLVLWDLRKDPEPRLAMAALLLPALGLRHFLLPPALAASMSELIATPYAIGLALELGINLTAAGCVIALARSLRERNRAELIQWDSMEAVRALGAFLTEQRGSLANGMSELLALGCERLGLELGIYTRIDDGQVLVVAVVDPSETPIKQGDAFELQQTLCHAVLDSGTTLAVERVAGSHWAVYSDHVALGIESYLGARVHVNGGSKGTLYFASRSPRRKRFTGVDKQLVGLMSDWLGGELERGELAEAEARARALAEINALAAAEAQAAAQMTGAGAQSERGDGKRLIQRRGDEIDRRRLDLNAALQQLESELRDALGDADRFTLSLAPEDPIVKLHRHEFDRVLWSLCWKALETTPSSAPLHVTAAIVAPVDGGSEAAFATLTVAVAGPALDARGIAELFEDRASSAPIATREGRLSLPRVQRLLQSSDGDLSVHSDPRVGTTLTAYLPIALAACPDPEPVILQ